MIYSVLAMFSAYESESWRPCESGTSDWVRACEEAGLAVYVTEPGDSEYAYLCEEECGSPNCMWCQLQDITASGILDRATLQSFVQETGIFFETENTIGTIGGPLAPIGWCPDVAFTCDDPGSIASVRITICTDSLGPPRNWPRAVKLMQMIGEV